MITKKPEAIDATVVQIDGSGIVRAPNRNPSVGSRLLGLSISPPGQCILVTEQIRERNNNVDWCKY
jgi:hypothetical protein